MLDVTSCLARKGSSLFTRFTKGMMHYGQILIPERKVCETSALMKSFYVIKTDQGYHW